MTTEFSTGHSELDSLLQGLRLGDNVVWRLQDLQHYHHWVERFAQATLSAKRKLIYCQFSDQPLPLAHWPEVETQVLAPEQGFAAFSQQVWRLINHYGPGAFYVFDPLSLLLPHWHSDALVTLFFQITCPRLYLLDTIAYFALDAERHSQKSWRAIRGTTQLLLDLFEHQQLYLQPVKVWQRQSAQMFLPHQWQQERLLPVLHSAMASRLQSQAADRSHSHQLLDPWDRLFWQAEALLQDEQRDPSLGQPIEPLPPEQLAQAKVDTQGGELDASRQACKLELIKTFVSKQPKQQALVAQYFTLAELVALRKRLLGTGYIGGKALGMLLARQILHCQLPTKALSYLDPHDSWYLASDNFYFFLQQTGLWPQYMALLQQPDGQQAQALTQAILATELPVGLQQQLLPLLDYYGQFPLLVRSSSLQEDGFEHAFAGKYDSVFVANQGDPEQRLQQLAKAIVQVYASCVAPDAMAYRAQHGLLDQEESMAILLQRVNGSYYGDYYCPPAALVAMSRNAFVWSAQMQPEAGMMRLVAGLGTRAVDRIAEDHAAVVALDAPHLRPWNSLQQASEFCQNQLDLLNLPANEMQSLPWWQLLNQGLALPKELLAEPDWQAMRRAQEIGRPQQVWRLTFKPLLTQTPLVPLLRQYLQLLERAYGQPVDTEFTLHLADNELALNLVQCRPMSSYASAEALVIPELPPEQIWLHSQGRFMGGSQCWPVQWWLQVLPEAFAALSLEQRALLCTLIHQWNRQLADKQGVVLLGPGRWGSRSPDLGLPVRFADISAVNLLIEVADLGKGLVPDLSFGSHFFQDLVESGMAYLALFPGQQASWQPEFAHQGVLQSHPCCEASADPAIAAALQVFDLRNSGIQLWADLRQQRLLCAKLTS